MSALQVAKLTAVLTVCRDQFARYEASHRAKGTEDANVKAEINKFMVDLINETLKTNPAPLPD
jgi:hypothetical protein